jgi:hypothetical protein
MMRKLLALLLVLCLLSPGGLALASDISGALYYAPITIGNSGDNTTNVATVASISTPSLMGGGFSNAAATNMAIRSSSGSDVPFMPGYDTNPWVMFLSNLAAYSYTGYFLYTAETSGGTIYYFPGDAGMETDDDPSMEPGAGCAFTFMMAAFIDPTGGEKVIYQKDDAFRVISNGGNITAELAGDVPAHMTDQVIYGTYDGRMNGECNGNYNTAWTQAVAAGGVNQYSIFIGQTPYFSIYRSGVYFPTAAAIPDDAVFTAASLGLYGQTDHSTTDFNIVVTNGQPTYPHNPIVDADYNKTFYAGDGGSLTTAGFTTVGYNVITLNATGRAWINAASDTKLTLRSDEDIAGSQPADDEYVECYTCNTAGTDKDPYLKVSYDYTDSGFGVGLDCTAAATDSGYHVVKVTSDGINMKIYVDDMVTEKGSVALGGAPFPDNDNKWYACQDGSVLYMSYLKWWVGANLRQHIEWKYGDTFTDLSENGNDATPSFRTTSSDADVSASPSYLRPVSEAKAPAYSLGDSPPWITEPPSVSGNFTTEVTPTFPGAGVIKEISDDCGTPSQLPLTIVAGFIILAISLSVSRFIRIAGSGSLIFKTMIVGCLMGIFIATLVFDLWMLLFFIAPAIAICMASTQKGWV